MGGGPSAERRVPCVHRARASTLLYAGFAAPDAGDELYRCLLVASVCDERAQSISCGNSLVASIVRALSEACLLLDSTRCSATDNSAH